MGILAKMFSFVDVSTIKVKRKEKKKTILKDIMNNPELFKLEAVIEGDEIIVRIKRREEKNEEES